MFDNISLFDKITAIIAGLIILVFILTLIISRIKYECRREALDEYWNECRDDGAFKAMDNDEEND